MIGGPPWVGKTTCAREVFTSLENSAWLDGDDVWRVNPFSVTDPRIRNSDRNISFVLKTYIESSFDYIIFSSVLLTNKAITDGILNAIEIKNYDLLFIMLSCSRSALKARSANQDSVNSPESSFMHEANERDAIHIETTDITPGEVAKIILNIVRDPSAAGVVPLSRGGIREWKLKDIHNDASSCSPG